MKRIFLIGVLVLWANLTLAEFQAYFSPQINTNDMTLERLIVDKLKNAKQSIDISIYTFSSNAIRALLLEKIKNEVEVRLLVNQGNQENVENFVRPLIAAGAQVRYVTKTNHHKFIIIDGKFLINSSGNFSGSARAQSYDENLIYCDQCAEHLNSFSAEFNALFRFSNLVAAENDVDSLTVSERKRRVHQNYSEVALFTSSNFTPYYRDNRMTFRTAAPNQEGVGNVDGVLVEAIDGAQESIIIATGHFRSKPLFDALVRANQRDIDIKVILDGQEYISAYQQRDENFQIQNCMEKYHDSVRCYKKGAHFGRLLNETNVLVRFKYYALRWYFPYAKQMHHKYMIVDSKTLYSGSYNWSYNAEFESFENVAIYHSSKLVAKFMDNFKRIFDYGEGEQGYQALIELFQNATSSIPTVFGPVSMTVEQIDQLRRLARRKCPNLYRNPIEQTVCHF